MAEEVFDVLLHQRHACLTTDQDHLRHITGRQLGVLQSNLAGLHGALDQVFDDGLELGARELDAQVLGAGCIGGDVGQIDVGLLTGRQLDLGLLAGLFEALHGQRVLAHVDAGLFEELIGQEVDDAQVEVFATQEGVAIGRQHFKLTLTIDLGDLDDRHVEGAATQIINGDLAVTAGLVHAISQRCGGGLVDDALDVEARDATGVFGGLTLRIVEVSRHGDHRFGDLFAQIVFSGLFHLGQHARRHFRRGHVLTLGLDPSVAVIGGHDLVRHHVDVALYDLVLELAADEALDGKQRVGRIGDGLTLGRLTHHHLTIFGESDDGRRGAVTLAVLENPCLATFHDGDAGIGRAQVDTDNSAHVCTPNKVRKIVLVC